MDSKNQIECCYICGKDSNKRLFCLKCFFSLKTPIHWVKDLTELEAEVDDIENRPFVGLYKTIERTLVEISQEIQ